MAAMNEIIYTGGGRGGGGRERHKAPPGTAAQQVWMVARIRYSSLFQVHGKSRGLSIDSPDNPDALRVIATVNRSARKYLGSLLQERSSIEATK